MRRTVPAFVAMLSLVALAAGPRPIPVSQVNAPITISVDAALNRHAIDPRIYSVSFADSATLTDLEIPINRWGGNTTSRYNWAISTANHARDYYFENYPDDAPNGGANGESADMFIQPTLAAGAQPIMTIPMITLLPTDRVQRCGYSIAKYAAQGCCYDHEHDSHQDCGDGFHIGDQTPLKGVNDPLDIATLYPATHQANWVQHNVDTFGPASTTGVKYYALDNEPGLWDSTHFDVHPDYATYDELWSKTQTYGALIKARDPSALVSGIEEWGWLGYFFSSSDWNQNITADRAGHGNLFHVDYLLTQARNYEQTQGIRVFDIASLHIYPQGDRSGHQEYQPWNSAEEIQTATKLLRNQSTRSLWDPTYVDQSWITDINVGEMPQGIIRLIPRLRDWVNKDYPGTKIGITEYNWGPDAQANDNDMSGATAQADILGIFGREGLDLGVRWTSPRAGSTAYNAFKMYRNYDGLHKKFGDLSVSAVAPDPDNVAAFAALRSSDHALTIMIVGKDITVTGTTPVTVNVANFVPSGSAEVRQLTAANTFAAATMLAADPGPSYTLNVPPSTITMLIIPGSYLDAPTGVVAAATSTTTVGIQWNPVAGANNYHVLRALTLSGGFTEFATTASLSLTDSGRTANKTYLYKVQASNATLFSAPSIIDPATTTMFTDDPLIVGTVAKKEHVNELRTAVAAMRFAAGLGVATFTDVPANAGTIVKAPHILELRTAVDQARATLGLTAGVWTDPAITATTPIRAAQIIAMRNSVK